LFQKNKNNPSLLAVFQKFIYFQKKAQFIFAERKTTLISDMRV